MQSLIPPNPLRQDCLGKLNRILDLALHTAEAAGAEGNHRIVLQAVREVTRIITLMAKMDFSKDQEMGNPRMTSKTWTGFDNRLNTNPAMTADVGKGLTSVNSGSDLNTQNRESETGKSKLETLFQSDDLADLSRDLLHNISHELTQLQSLQGEAEYGRQQTAKVKRSGKKTGNYREKHLL